MSLFDLADYVSGSAEPWTAKVIGSLIEAKKPHRLIETGTFLGMTTAVMHAAMQTYATEHGSLLSTIDIEEDRAKAFSALLDTWQGYQSVGVEVLHGDALKWLATLADGSIDFAFIDDDHTDSHVDAELQVLLPKMARGGIVTMHDVVGPYGLGAVCKKYGGSVLEFPRLHIAGGLGIITT